MIVPGTANTPTHAREVATVSLSGMRNQAEKAGTIKMPPPTPSSPERPPRAHADQRDAPEIDVLFTA